MAKHDWKALLGEFAIAHSETGIAPVEWCEKKGVPYSSAKRYITIKAATELIKHSQVRNSQQGDSQIRKNNSANDENTGDADCTDDEEINVSADASADSGADPDQDAKPHGRDQRGRFAEGNPGNTNVPANAFGPRNQRAKKHSAYAKFLDADELFEAVADSDLNDELIFTRARALSVTKTMKQIIQDLQNSESVDQRIELYDKLLRAEQGLDRNIARIESIERTLSALALDAVNRPRLSEDTRRIKAATSKLKAETQKLTAESKDVTTPLSGIVSDIQGMSDNGLMSK